MWHLIHYTTICSIMASFGVRLCRLGSWRVSLLPSFPLFPFPIKHSSHFSKICIRWSSHQLSASAATAASSSCISRSQSTVQSTPTSTNQTRTPFQSQSSFRQRSKFEFEFNGRAWQLNQPEIRLPAMLSARDRCGQGWRRGGGCEEGGRRKGNCNNSWRHCLRDKTQNSTSFSQEICQPFSPLLLGTWHNGDNMEISAEGGLQTNCGREQEIERKGGTVWTLQLLLVWTQNQRHYNRPH